MDIESTKKRIEIIEALKKEMKVLTDMLKDAMQNDPALAKAEEHKSKLVEEAKVAKNKVTERSDIKRIIEDIKEKRDEIKDAQETLSLELIEYYRLNSALTIEDSSGKVREIKFNAKLSTPRE